MRSWSKRERKRGRAARRFAVLAARPKWQARIAQAIGSDEPALRVWAAVLDDAIAALRGRHPQARTHGACGGLEVSAEVLWREAVAWLLSRDAEPLGTFESVCEVLELPTETVRRDLCALAAEHAPPPQVPAEAIAAVA